VSQLTFPPLPLNRWQPTRDTLAVYARLLGKIRRALTPPQKHWGHASLRAAAVGLTTTPIPAGDQTFELLLDLTAHRLALTTSRGARAHVELAGQSPAAFRDAVLAALAAQGIRPALEGGAFDDAQEGVYDATAVSRFWQALSQIDAVLKAFRHGFRGESSPVQFWPHHFDLAVTWFSGRLVPDQEPDDPEYADEQMNFGFSTGDGGVPEPYFYATAYPTPDGFTTAALPEGASWRSEGWTGAVLPYARIAATADGKTRLRDFLHTVHRAGAERMA
jgi:hypothetical protein